ncbi:glutamate racemase [Flavicella sediminum]|uniref:glutamate racemase n=1 Tax=Flavicella sediminum TaxID=2585141 RepID=UPI00111F4C83|nr:glutamate racemase [Flavicella sediminum]
MNTQPIGLFDSGIGGISIWKEILNVLPYENSIYLADSKNAPYGQKSKEEIIALCIKNTDYLIARGCKIIVVACNTATTNAIEILRARYDIPFIGIEPAIKPAALKTLTHTIGILATKGTLNSSLFAETSKKYISDIKVVEQIGEGLVPLIENGLIESEEMEQLLKKHLAPMLQNNIDCLVLGCTHYPFLIPQIKKIIGNSIQIIDSGLAVAKQTKAVLERIASLAPQQIGKHEVYINSKTDTLQTFLKEIENVHLAYKEF